MIRNFLKLVVFALDTINGQVYLSAMTSQRKSDGRFELPAYEMDDALGDDIEKYVLQCLSGSIPLLAHCSVYPVGSYPLVEAGDRKVATVYGVFLDEKPADAYGINWVIISPVDYPRRPLDETDETILADARQALSMQVLCGKPSFTEVGRKRLMEQFVSKDALKQMAALLDGFAKVDVSGLDAVSDADLKTELEKRVKKDDGTGNREPQYFIYNYFHPSLAVDVVVLSKNTWQDKSGNWHVELKIPLIKRSEGLGKGWWGLPGGFIKKEHFVAAEWDMKETDFDPGAFPAYMSSLNNGKGVIKLAARDILKNKTGINLDDDIILHPLYVRDNPLRGTADGVPVIAETLLAIVSDYDRYTNLEPDKNSNVEKVRWFTVKRFLYSEDNVLIKEEDGMFDTGIVPHLSSEKRSPLDLSYDEDVKEAFIEGDSLIVNYFKRRRDESQKAKTLFKIPEDNKERQEKCIFADHRDAIIDALQYIKNHTFTTTLLKDFMLKPEDDIETKDIEIGEFQAVYEALVFPEDISRQNFQNRVISKDNSGNNDHKPNNGFLFKPDGNPRGKYRLDEERFEKFIYMQTR